MKLLKRLKADPDNHYKGPRITQEERELVLAIMDGNPRIMTPLFHFRTQWVIARDVPYIEGLRWLKKNLIVGDTFLLWMSEHKNSPLLAMADLRRRVFSDFKTRKLIFKGG